jgi:CO dehydrogenase nickel-insertion accessory protein CooC1
MNKALLRSVMVLHNDTDQTLADYLGISKKSVNDKINENRTEFKQSEIAAIKRRYSLTDEQVSDIFFS